ncbi:MAG: hypothetical protein HDT47_02555 [Ruminococcaceae bacterium]|nr:hypothetical protein [Oscillospiraceae bacterium]
MAKKVKEEFIEADNSQKLFEKEQLMSSERFRNKRDLLNALLRENKLYAVSQAEEMIEIYMKGKVK